MFWYLLAAFHSRQDAKFDLLWTEQPTLTGHLRCVFQAKSTTLTSGLVQDEFEKTSVKMSTYLVAFIVADFTPISKNVSKTLVGLVQIEVFFTFSSGCT